MPDERAVWSSAYQSALPDSAFACVQNGERFYPHHNASGNLDLPHLRAALSRIGDPSNQQCGKAHLEAHAKSQGMRSDMTDLRPPRDNLVRALAGGVTLEEDGKTLFGRIGPANQWAEINSSVEGNFMERNSPGAFKKTFGEVTPKIQFQHGKDPQVGNQLIAVPREFGEDAQGGFYRGEILPGLPQLVVEGLKRGLYGSSHTFSVIREKWVDSPPKSDYNPKGLPERTIVEARVPELGPVTWPAFAGAYAGVRSLTDEYTLNRLRDDPVHLQELLTEPAPSIDAGAGPHLEPERREETQPTPTKEKKVTEYVTRDEKAARVKDLEGSIGSRAIEYPGVFPDDVQATDDTENAERDALVRDIKAWDARQARLAEFASDPKRTEGANFTPPTIVRTASIEDIYNPNQFSGIGYRSAEERSQTIRDNALRSLESSRLDASGLAKYIEHIDVPAKDASSEMFGLPEMATRMLVTGSPVYKRAFAKYLRHGSGLAWTQEEQRAAALAVVGTTTTGGYAVPYIFDPTMIHTGAWTAENPFRRACRIETITGGNNWRTVTVGAVTSAYATEALAASEGGPTFGQPTYTVQRAQAFATLSIETIEDRPDVTSELTSVFAESKDTLEENEFAVGSGATVHPLGMFTDTAYTNQDTATNDVTAIADLQVLEGALPLRYRAKGAFFMNRSTLRQLQALDTTYRYFSGAGIQFPGNPQPNQQGSNGGGNTGLSLLGYPIWEVPSAVSTLTTDGAIIVVFADPRSYIIVDRIGMNVEVIQNMLNGATPSFPTGQRGVYCYWRNTAKPVVADAGRSLSVQ